MLTDEKITQFQILYKNRFGKEISRKEAYEMGIRLIQLVRLIRKPTTNNNLENSQKCNLQKEPL